MRVPMRELKDLRSFIHLDDIRGSPQRDNVATFPERMGIVFKVQSIGPGEFNRALLLRTPEQTKDAYFRRHRFKTFFHIPLYVGGCQAPQRRNVPKATFM